MIEPGSLLAIPLSNSLYGVIWITQARVDEGGYFNFLVLDGFHSAIPAERELKRLALATSPGPALPGEEHEVWKGCFFGKVPKDFGVAGKRKLPASVDRRAEGTMVFQNGEHLRKQLLVAWRMIHDRPALEAEWAASAEARKKKADERRRKQTLPQMMRERIFPRWAERMSPAALRTARRIFRDATAELIALQESGTKRQRIAVLKRIVTGFNALDGDEAAIETVEREQIVARVEELAALVGVSNEDERLTGHRDW